jgi:hypothetical protein
VGDGRLFHSTEYEGRLGDWELARVDVGRSRDLWVQSTPAQFTSKTDAGKLFCGEV